MKLLGGIPEPSFTDSLLIYSEAGVRKRGQLSKGTQEVMC